MLSLICDISTFQSRTHTHIHTKLLSLVIKFENWKLLLLLLLFIVYYYSYYVYFTFPLRIILYSWILTHTYYIHLQIYNKVYWVTFRLYFVYFLMLTSKHDLLFFYLFYSFIYLLILLIFKFFIFVQQSANWHVSLTIFFSVNPCRCENVSCCTPEWKFDWIWGSLFTKCPPLSPMEQISEL